MVSPTVVHGEDVVKCWREPGYAAAASITGGFDFHPDFVYKAITNPERPVKFRTVKSITRFEPVDGSESLRRYAVEYLSQWKFLGFGGEFTIHFDRTEDDSSRSIISRLARPGMLKKLDCVIQVSPAPRPACALVSIQQMLTPSFPAIDPLSRRIMQGTVVRQVRESLEDVREHVVALARELPASEPSDE